MAKVDLGDWRDQWARVQRWHRRLTPIRERLPIAAGRDEAIDTVLAFFMVCYHLSDAIHQSRFRSKTDVDAYVKGSDALSLCRDICIAVKHFEIRDPWRPTSSLSTATLSNVYISDEPVPDDFQFQRWAVVTDNGRVDMFDLADDCIEAWARFLDV